MRTTALVMGILGGVSGVLAALFALAVGGIADSTQTEVLGAAALGFAVLGIVAGALSGSKPGWSAGLLTVSAIGIIIAISAFGILPGVFFLVGSLCAFIAYRGSRKQPEAAVSTTTLA
jgi:hypothetical protein